MKKTLLFLGLASVMSAFTGCVKDVIDDGGIAPEVKGGAPAVLRASVGGENETRTQIVDGKMVWKTGDKLMVFSKNAEGSGVEYTLDPAFDGQKAGEFTPAAEAPALSSLEYFTQEDKRYVAVYPAQQFSALPSPFWAIPTEIGATIPAHQKYKIGGYDPMAVPMMAVFENVEDPMKFKFMGAMLRTSITSENFATLTKIILRALPYPGGSVAPVIAGDVLAKFMDDGTGIRVTEYNRDDIYVNLASPMISDETDVPRYAFTRSGTSQIILEDPGETSAGIMLFSDPTEFTFGLMPNDYPNGMAIKCILPDGDAVEMKTAPGTIYSGQMINLPTFELPFDFGESYFSPDIYIDGSNILFNEYAGVSDDVESFDLMIFFEDNEIGAMRLTDEQIASGLAMDKLVAYMDTLVGTKIQSGSTVEYEIVLRANFKDTYKAMSAAYSIPDYYSYTASLPALIWAVYSGYEFGDPPLTYYVTVSNYAMYEGHTIEYAFLEGKDLVDFSAATFTLYKDAAMNSVMLPKYATDYTFAARIKKGSAIVKTFYLNVKSMEEPKAPALDILLASDGVMFSLTGVLPILQWFGEEATYACHFKYSPTSPTDMVGATVKTFGGDQFLAEWGFGWDFLYDYNIQPEHAGVYNVQVVMKSSHPNGFGKVNGEIISEIKTNVIQTTLVVETN